MGEDGYLDGWIVEEFVVVFEKGLDMFEVFEEVIKVFFLLDELFLIVIIVCFWFDVGCLLYGEESGLCWFWFVELDVLEEVMKWYVIVNVVDKNVEFGDGIFEGESVGFVIDCVECVVGILDNLIGVFLVKYLDV